MTLQCQTLQEVDLTDCESLTNSICEVFSDGGGCPMLKSLVLDNCEVCELGPFSFHAFIILLNLLVPRHLKICLFEVVFGSDTWCSLYHSLVFFNHYLYETNFPHKAVFVNSKP